MRAYLRIDPGLADRKADYPDGAFRAFIECLVFGEQQPQRGRFRNAKLLRVLLEKRGKWVPFLIARGDLLEQNGQLYVDGWDEWQEGDWKVYERVARIRNRKNPTDGTVTDGTNGSVQPRARSGGGGGKHISGGGAPYNGDTFMGFPPKPGSHVGQHLNCAVCAPLRKPEPAA